MDKILHDHEYGILPHFLGFGRIHAGFCAPTVFQCVSDDSAWQVTEYCFSQGVWVPRVLKISKRITIQHISLGSLQTKNSGATCLPSEILLAPYTEAPHGDLTKNKCHERVCIRPQEGAVIMIFYPRGYAVRGTP